MESELNRKLIIILTSIFLPLLAAVFAQANPRRSNIYQGIISFGIIILYQQLIQFGGIMTDRTGVSSVADDVAAVCHSGRGVLAPHCPADYRVERPLLE